MDSISSISTSQPTPCVNIGRWVHGLSSNTLYYYRAFATDTIAGITVYGIMKSFTSLVYTAIDEIEFLNPIQMNVMIYNTLGELVVKDTVVGKFTMPENLHGTYVYVATSKDGSIFERGKIFSN